MKIQLKNVDKKIRGTYVLRDVNLTLESGHVYGLWGENGSGKTMLLRILAGLIYPTHGTATVDGKRLGKEIDFRESVGLLLENPAFLDEYTGKRNLQLIAALKHRAGEQEIDKALKVVGLNPTDRRTYRKYSLGMKQRLGIAAALMEQPDLILLDEPTNALDVEAVAMLKQLILAEKSCGALLVVASHDGQFLTDVCDEIVQVTEGHLKREEEMA
ncbi:MAG: ATP-binding cassette domain-containing protein [Clostridiales bacterium]|nr:ATP-binding cassette domain-containing protein [Clostridiales bacterium]